MTNKDLKKANREYAKKLKNEIKELIKNKNYSKKKYFELKKRLQYASTLGK